jgi:hypothetical protein
LKFVRNVIAIDLRGEVILARVDSESNPDFDAAVMLD